MIGGGRATADISDTKEVLDVVLFSQALLFEAVTI